MSATLAKGSGDGPVLGQEHPEVIVSDEKLLLGCFTSFGTTQEQKIYFHHYISIINSYLLITMGFKSNISFFLENDKKIIHKH